MLDRDRGLRAGVGVAPAQPRLRRSRGSIDGSDSNQDRRSQVLDLTLDDGLSYPRRREGSTACRVIDAAR